MILFNAKKSTLLCNFCHPGIEPRIFRLYPGDGVQASSGRREDIQVYSEIYTYWPKIPAPIHTQSTVVSCLLWWGAGVNPKQIKNGTTGSVISLLYDAEQINLTNNH